MRRTRRFWISMMWTLAASTLVCGSATAQQSDEPGSEGTAEQPDLLAGPQVDAGDEDRPAPPHEMDPMMQRLRERPLPPRIWLRELRDIELTERQQQFVDTALQEFRNAQREHYQAHREQLRSLRQQLRDARQGDHKVPDALRKQMQEIRAAAPSFEDCQQRIWSELTVEQREGLTNRLNEARQEMIRRFEQRRQQMGERGMEPGPDMRGEGRRPPRPMRPVRPVRPPHPAPPDAPPPPEVPGRLDVGPTFGGYDEMGVRRLLFLMKHQTPDARRRTEQRLRVPPEEQ